MQTEVGKEIEVWLGLWYPQPVDEMLEQPEDEDEALARALECSLLDAAPEEAPIHQAVNVQPEPDVADSSSDDEEFIEVDNEARLLQEERILEGEEIEVDVVIQPPLQPHEQTEEQQGGASASGWRVKQMSDKKKKSKIERGFRHHPMKRRQATEVEDVRTLSEKDRWRLYHYWLNKHLKEKKHQLSRIAERYNGICEYYTEQQEAMNSYAIQGADVIGMTTTGAAKHHYVLKNIHPKIVVIEEAAEVFESHIVTSLSPSVQQLILIGDHEQLRPKPNYYKLEKEYDFAVSLFERLTINGIRYTTLGVQHRMRPEIARLVCPHIYDRLKNHESVKNFEHIAGLGKDLFFIDHNSPEKSNPDGDMRSHNNSHEADFLVALCRYLLSQGYKPSQITLLTMYRGQLLELKKKMRRTEFQGVRVAAVDDFQGEENDVILLSLVRSNSDGDIGFLRVRNRVCVSLSRARKGLYVIGNLSMLRNRDDTVWPEILADMEQHRCVGRALPLQCQIHPDQRVAAAQASDFSKCPEGGCQKMCGTRLECGHTCSHLCHPQDRDHKLLYKCKKQCIKTLPCGHSCKSKCYQCTGECPPCTQKVDKRMPYCGHTIILECPTDPYKAKCKHQCTKLLPCGHLCQEMCFEPCTVRCPVRVEKTLSCGHKVNDSCYKKPQNIKCPEPCESLLDCEHPCSGSCGKCHQSRLHVPCAKKCERPLVCGHLCNFPCTANCPPCTHPCNNYCVHSECPKRCYELCAPCMEPCEWECEHFKCTRKCGELCNRPRCDQPCRKRLKCRHPCIGLCGERCPKLCRVCNHEEVTEIFFGNEDEEDARFIELRDCDHIFEVEALDYYMEIDDGKPNEIQMKSCPKCKTPIRKSLRYGNIIKTTLADLEKIKQKQLVVREDKLAQQVRGVRGEIVHSTNAKHIVDDLKRIEAIISHSSKTGLIPHRINAMSNQLTFLPQVVKLHDTLDAVKCPSCQFSGCRIQIDKVCHGVHILHEFFMQEFLSDQQLSDIQCELRRLMCTAKLCDLKFKVEAKKCKVSLSDEVRLNGLAVKVFTSGCHAPQMTPEVEQEVSTLIVHFNEQYSVNGLTKAERIEIVNAIGLSKGHWFKCPNGHLYCIGECGGATEIAKCPDCGARVGGQGHRLLEDNQLAPEMDGARYAAWSTTANLADYDLEELQQRFQ